MAMHATCGDRIHVAGNAVLDLLVRGVDPAAGEDVASWGRGSVQFLDHPVIPALGGTAATAYLLGRLGTPVSLNTQIGDDALGGVIRHWLADAGVSLVCPVATSTATNVILLATDGTPRWHYHTGQKIDWRRSAAVTDATWFYASGYGQADGEDLAQLRDVFEAVRSRGVRVAFDPGPWLFARTTREEMEQAWAQVDCLIGTEAELSTWYAGDSLEELVARLLARGPQGVVVKCGAEGAVYGVANGKVERCPTEPVENANTVGAGDTFNARLLHGLAQGEPPGVAVAEAVCLATAAVKRGKGVLGALG